LSNQAKKMAQVNESCEERVVRYLRSGGASGDDCAAFLNWCTVLCTAQQEAGVETRIRYNVYKLWARLLRKRQAPYNRKDRFIFDDSLKNYIRYLTGGVVINQAPHQGAKHVSSTVFVEHVVRRLDNAF